MAGGCGWGTDRGGGAGVINRCTQCAQKCHKWKKFHKSSLVNGDGLIVGYLV